MCSYLSLNIFDKYWTLNSVIVYQFPVHVIHAIYSKGLTQMQCNAINTIGMRSIE